MTLFCSGVPLVRARTICCDVSSRGPIVGNSRFRPCDVWRAHVLSWFVIPAIELGRWDSRVAVTVAMLEEQREVFAELRERLAGKPE